MIALDDGYGVDEPEGLDSGWDIPEVNGWAAEVLPADSMESLTDHELERLSDLANGREDRGPDQEALRAAWNEQRSNQELAAFTAFTRELMEARGFDSVARKWVRPTEAEPAEEAERLPWVREDGSTDEAELDRVVRARMAAHDPLVLAENGWL